MTTMRHLEKISLNEIKLVGLSTRATYSSNSLDSERTICAILEKYASDKLFEEIPNRTSPGATFVVYTDFAPDQLHYTCFVGEEVLNLDQLDSPELQTLIIPAQQYLKLTSPLDRTSEEILKLWQYLWAADPTELGGQLTHLTDFELYRPEGAHRDGSSVELYASLR